MARMSEIRRAEMLLRWAWLLGYMLGNCGCGGKFVLLPKNLENVAAFSEFLCPPHLLGSNFPPHFCLYFRIFTRRVLDVPKSYSSA